MWTKYIPFLTAITVFESESYKITLDCIEVSSSFDLSNESRHHNKLKGCLSQPLAAFLLSSSSSIAIDKLFEELDSNSLVELDEELSEDVDVSDTFLTRGIHS